MSRSATLVAMPALLLLLPALGIVSLSACGRPKHEQAPQQWQSDSKPLPPPADERNPHAFPRAPTLTPMEEGPEVVERPLWRFALLARDALALSREATVTDGDVGVHERNPSGLALLVGEGARIEPEARAFAPAIDLLPGALVGDVYTDALRADGASYGRFFPFLSPPPLPRLFPLEIGAEPVIVGDGASLAIAPGTYSDVLVGTKAVLHLSSGMYSFRNVCVQNFARVEADGPVMLSVAEALELRKQASLETAASMTAAELRLQVDGRCASDGAAGGSCLSLVLARGWPV